MMKHSNKIDNIEFLLKSVLIVIDIFTIISFPSNNDKHWLIDEQLCELGFIEKDNITIEETLYCIGITNDQTYLQNSLANVLTRLQEEKDGNPPSPEVLEECREMKLFFNESM